ncbi:unnamed protein product [Caenorhabditis nigoni]
MNCFLDVFRCVSKRRYVSPINLIDLPQLVLETILENLDIHSILTLRNVCHDLRGFIDDVKPSSHLTNIIIYVSSNLISLQLTFPSGSQPFNGRPFPIDFRKTKTGCRLDNYTRMGLVQKRFKNEDFLEFEYYPNLEFDRNLEPIAEEVLREFKEILESRRSQIQVENFQMSVIRQDQVAQILPFVDSKNLRKIEISGKKSFPMNSFETDELEKLDQWKQAKDLKIWRFDVLAPFEKFTHFRNVELFIQNVSVGSILELKEIFKDCPTVEYFNIKFEYIDDLQLLADILGPVTTANEENEVLEYRWFYRLPEPLKCLSIAYFSDSFIIFEVVKRSEAPRRRRLLKL